MMRSKAPMVMMNLFMVLCLSAVISESSEDEKSSQVNTCISCHSEEIDDEQTELVENFLSGIHARRGILCVDCHGGNASEEEMEDAMDEDEGFSGEIQRVKIPDFCARCHSDPKYMRGFDPNISTDQHAKYMISGHGVKLAKFKDEKVAVCIDCHGVHGILPSDDPTSKTFVSNVPALCSSCHSDSVYMADRSIPINQFELYKASVHGIALLEKGDRAAPSCSGCHGSHEARIPDPSGVANTCAQCHNFIREMFVASPHKAAHEKNNLAECEVCHGYHSIEKASDEMLGGGKRDVCVDCHESDSKGMEISIAMKLSLDSLNRFIDSAHIVVGLARIKGMDTDDSEYKIGQAKDKLIQSRALIHTFNSDEVSKVTGEGMLLARSSTEAGIELLEKYDFRRYGFFLSVIVIFILSGLLTAKIRSLNSSNDLKQESLLK